MKSITRLRVLTRSGPARLTLVKDLDSGEYYIEKSLAVDIEFQKRLFTNEITVHSRFDHRYLIKFVELRDPFTFLMEYAEKGSLQNILEADSDLRTRQKYCINFLKGLEYLHKSGYVHNDIKPSNILLTKDNRAKLADFAFCGRIDEITFDNVPDYFVLGTESFKSTKHPLTGKNRISNDIYSVGMVFYLLFGSGKMYKHINLDLIGDRSLRLITQSCLNGTFQEVSHIIECMHEIQLP